MRHYLLQRLLLVPFTLIGVTMLVFCLTRLVPGGPIEQMLQQQAMAALSGDKASTSSPNAPPLNAEERERLEEHFNLHEPAWRAYLQWLGIMPRDTLIVKAEFQADGSAYLALPRPDGSSKIVEVRHKERQARYLGADKIKAAGWEIRLESPQERIERAQRQGQAPPSTPPAWRVIASQKAFDGLLQGSLGKSFKYNEPVWGMMMERLPVSLYFGLLGALICYGVSIPLGVFKAIHHKSIWDSLSSIFIFIGYAVPGFALGAVLLVYLGARLGWLPLYGLVSDNFAELSLSGKMLDLARHTVLPLTCYVISTFALTTMLMKNQLMEQLSADYLRTAIAKGISFRRAIWQHALRNAIIPIAASLGTVIGVIVGGSILIERVFDIQGFGLLSYQALLDKDYTLIMGTLLVGSLFIVVGNLLADLLVAWIDRRIRFD